MSTGWSLFVIVLVLANVIGCVWLLVSNRNVKIDPAEKGRPTGHDFDGIEELNNPLPAWWTWLFVGSIIFSAGYLVLYPGFGNFEGILGWTSAKEVEQATARADAQYGPIFAGYLAREIPDLLGDERAVGMGSRIFANRCSVCHGSDARGGPGYPNLANHDWLYGGTPDRIVTSVTNGRNGLMPPFAAAIGGDEGVRNMTEYVLSLSGRDHDPVQALAAKPTYDSLCGICHGANSTGNIDIGAPDLTDNIWLHGGRREDIVRALNEGLASQMPAHRDLLSPARIHLAALYVFSLSADAETSGAD
jgi:cytochrome c oxidase cbb3-type subunit 3